MLRTFKEVAFKIFLIQGKDAYESVSLGNISEKFQLERSEVMKQSSKLIMSRKVQARLDLASDSLVYLAQNQNEELEHIMQSHLDQIS